MSTTGENKKEQELKSCPFCGHTKPEILTALIGQYRWMVQCEKRECRASTNNFEHQIEAVTAWNKRASLTSQSSESIPAGAGEFWTAAMVADWADRDFSWSLMAKRHNATVTALSARAEEAERTLHRYAIELGNVEAERDQLKTAREALEKIIVLQQEVSPAAWTMTEFVARAALGKPER